MTPGEHAEPAVSNRRTVARLVLLVGDETSRDRCSLDQDKWQRIFGWFDEFLS